MSFTACGYDGTCKAPCQTRPLSVRHTLFTLGLHAYEASTKFKCAPDVHERSHPPKTAHSHASHPLVT